eukprot:TRINITY_DN3881_c0_g1_i1.p1 TRINITY_DN3881_c0_g1~~TRINITY_DN3881_c0_g1_i1.p1  ORF type:complete len:330 (+),score=40.66 TRINITY_DN3881_c0_g1_i1:62-1051(+)
MQAVAQAANPSTNSSLASLLSMAISTQQIPQGQPGASPLTPANPANKIIASEPLSDLAPLPCHWMFWVSWKLEDVADTRQIGRCTCLQEFWQCFGSLLLAEMPVNVSLQVFREGVTPTYDNPLNRNGGHFKIRATSLQAACRLWAKLVYATVCEQLVCNDQVCGCAVVKKNRSITVQVWIASSLYKPAVKSYLTSTLMRGDYFRLKYCPHKYLLRTIHTKQAMKMQQGELQLHAQQDYDEDDYDEDAPQAPARYTADYLNYSAFDMAPRVQNAPRVPGHQGGFSVPPQNYAPRQAHVRVAPNQPSAHQIMIQHQQGAALQSAGASKLLL